MGSRPNRRQHRIPPPHDFEVITKKNGATSSLGMSRQINFNANGGERNCSELIRKGNFFTRLSHSLQLFITALSFAAAASGNDLNYLAGTADAVVVGSINTRLEDANRVSFSISVERVIKGEANMKVAHVLHPWKRLGIELSSRGSNKPIDAPVYGMWFLQRAGPSEWDVIPANGRDGMLFNLYLPAAQVLPQRYTTKLATSVIDSIVVEFAAGAEAERNRLRTAVELLKTIQTPAIGTVTDAYVTSSTPGFQIAGITLALAHNNPDSLSALVRVWPGIRQDLAREYTVTSLRDSFRDVSPAAVTQLAAIIDDGSLPELRSAGIRAIATIPFTRKNLFRCWRDCCKATTRKNG